MPFGLSNAPATFQNIMNYIFKDLLLKFVLVFFDDILVYSKSGEEHILNLRKVFDILKKHQFVVNRGKYVLAARRIEYLGHFISAEGIATDPRKITAISEWPTPKGTKQVKSFLGLTRYYRRFVRGYSSIAKPLTELLKREGFKWDQNAERAFNQLKEALMTAPVLCRTSVSYLW